MSEAAASWRRDVQPPFIMTQPLTWLPHSPPVEKALVQPRRNNFFLLGTMFSGFKGLFRSVSAPPASPQLAHSSNSKRSNSGNGNGTSGNGTSGSGTNGSGTGSGSRN